MAKDQFGGIEVSGNTDQFGGTLVEDAPRPETSTAARVMSDLGKSLKSGVLQLPGQIAGLADVAPALAVGARPFTRAADALGDMTGFQPGKWAKEIQYSPEAQASQAEIDKTWDDPSAGAADVAGAYLRNPAYTANQVAQSVPGMVAGGVASRLIMGAGAVAPVVEKGIAAVPGYLERVVGSKMAAPIAGGIGEGAQQTGQQMDQGSELPDQQKNAAAALASGVIDAGIGAGLGRAANALGLETVETIMAKGLKYDQAAKPLKLGARTAGGATGEAAQEVLQSGQEQAWQNFAEDKPLGEGVARQAVEGGLTGGVMGGAANVMGAHQAPAPAPAPAPAVAIDPNAGPISRAASMLALPAPVTPANWELVDDRVLPAPPTLPAGAAPEPAPVALLPAPDPDEQTIMVGSRGDAAPMPSAVRTEAQNRAVEAQIADERAASVQADDIVGEQGRPFKTRIAAQAAAKRAGAGYAPTQINGGFVARPTSDVTDVAAKTEIDTAAHAAATSPHNDLPEPTDGQKEAGNYQKGHVQLHGLNITVENPRGSERTGKRPDGSQWSHTMSDHYGYIKRTVGADDEQVDVYLGPDSHNAERQVYVIDQLHQDTGKFDEHKAMLGYRDEASAIEAYKSNFDAGWKVGPVTPMPIGAFKEWLKDGNTKAQAAKAAPSPAIDQGAAAGGQAAGSDAAGNGVPVDHVAPVQLAPELSNGQDASPAAPVQEVKAPGTETPTATRGDAAGTAAAATGGGTGDLEAAGVRPLTLGITPNAADPVTVKDGIVHIGKDAAQNFDSGELIRVPEGATDAQIKKALTDGGAVSRRQKFYGGAKEEASTPAEQANTTAAAGPETAEAGTGETPAPGKSEAPPEAPENKPRGQDSLLQFPVGTHVRIVSWNKVGSENGLYAGRIGTVTKGHFDGWYIKLDPKPRERTKKEILVLQSNGLERIETETASTDPATAVPTPTTPARPATWRTNFIAAAKVARELGIDPKGKKLAALVAAIDAKDAEVGTKQPESGAAPAKVETPAAQQEQPTKNVLQQAREKAKVKAEAEKKAAAQAKADAREAERTLFNSLAARTDLDGKPVEDVLAAVQAGIQAAGVTVDGLKVQRLARAIHKQLAKTSAARAKEQHRIPAVRAAALGAAVTEAYPDAEIPPEQHGAFISGFDHAMAGRTKSTLSGDHLADMQRGYEAAMKWRKTEEGAAWYEGRPVNKLQNTGIDLRRHWELMREQMKAGESDIKRAWAQIERATTRADLFAPLLPEGVSPGFRLYVEAVRKDLRTFKDWLVTKHVASRNWSGEYFRGMVAPIDKVVEGSIWPDVEGVDSSQFIDDEAYRAEWLRKAADQYLNKVREFLSFLAGKSSVLEAAQAFDEKFVDKEFVARHPNGVGYKMAPEALNEYGKKHAGESYYSKGGELWDSRPGDLVQLRSTSEWTKELVDKEATIALPTKATPLTPPRLDRVTREGMTDQRKGENVTPQQFKETFGLADVGFGKWVGSKQDQDHLNYAFDALMDLANHFGTAPKNLGFGGQLHLTIGALGHGKFAAHFQAAHPSPEGTVQVINLTNTRGDGTVYHEWTHGLDHNLGGQWKEVRRRVLRYLTRSLDGQEQIDANAARFLTGGWYWKGDKRASKADAARRTLQRDGDGKNTTAYKQNADKLGEDYWGNEAELIARAAEAWAADTLGGTDTYLVNPAWVGDGAVTKEKGYRGTPYPSGTERKNMGEVFTALAKAIKWKDGRPTVALADFEAALPEHFSAGKNRVKELLQPGAMEALEQELLAKEAADKAAFEQANADKARREQEEIDKLAEQQINDLQPIVDPATPAETMGPLSDGDLSDIFDQAAAELREEGAEKPDQPAPGVHAEELPAEQDYAAERADKDKPSARDLAFIRDRVANGSPVLLPGTAWAHHNGFPTIQSMQSIEGASVRHVGYGMFEVTGRDLQGTFDAGGAMQQAPDGTPYTIFSKRGGTWEYPKARLLEVLDKAIGKAEPTTPNRAASPTKEQSEQYAKEDAQQKTAAQLIADAAKLGVNGADEALKGLSALFGGKPGRLNSFGAGFDEETYQAAKPHFEAALKAFQASGKSLKDLFKMLIQRFGDGIKEYAIRFAKDQNLTTHLGAQAQDAPLSPAATIARTVAKRLETGAGFDWKMLFALADSAFGGTQAEGKYSVQDAYDALELGMNQYLRTMQGRAYNPAVDADAAGQTVAALERVTQLLPTQTKRTKEKDQYQQFSTVPAFAFVANWAANIQPGDVMMEPSAGIGGLAVFAKNAGARLILNELSSSRAAVLQEIFPGEKIYTENAEQIDNILPESEVPTVVVMNPPFSNSAATGVNKKTAIGAQHVEQALARLAPGGRLVAIVGEGMERGKPTFAAWWKKIDAAYDVRAVIPVDGAGYAKYGTTFNNALLVIDKVAPSGRNVVTGKASNYTELIPLLGAIRNERPASTIAADGRGELEQHFAEQEHSGPVRQGEAETGAGTGPGGADLVGEGQPAGKRPGVGGGGGRRGDSGRSGRPGSNVPESGPPGSGERAEPGGSGPAGNEPGAGVRDTASGVTLGTETVGPQALTESIFENYQPQRLQVPGAKAHPGALVQSAAMASVLPPKPVYVPNLPAKTITEGALSIAQIEAVVYAGQAHAELLERTPEGVQPRRGFFIGDGTGVGKGREIGGIILDNIRQGRKKHVWISEKQGLLNDAARDFAGVLGTTADSVLKSGQLFNLSKRTQPGTWKVTAEDGILFTTYSTLRSAQKFGQFDAGDPVDLKDGSSGTLKSIAKSKRTISVILEGQSKAVTIQFAAVDSIGGDAAWERNLGNKPPAGWKPRTRMEQIKEWLGPDFDGVIAFDEAHNAGNAVAIKGERGFTDPSAQALAVVELQKQLPNARVVYVSATGATQVSNLSFATRLGLWGPGTPFAAVHHFIAQMTAGGLATMELVARDMKQMGAYLARSLSYDGVTYSRVEHELTEVQREIYDRLAQAWQVVLKNMNVALEITKGGKDGKAKGAARSAFWGAQQRFFNQIITSMQMPAVLAQMEADIAAGHAVVAQLVNTNEAQANRAMGKLKEEDADLEELDLTPRDQLIGMVEKAFPVQQYEEYVDDEGKKRVRPVVDSKGNPVLNKQAVKMRDKLVDDLRNIRVPEGPLELLVNHFGPDVVAEVTGRGQRVVAGQWSRERGEKAGKAFIQKRGSSANRADSEAFQADKKRLLVFSDAGGTGFSFHSDLGAKNQRKRMHYLLQPGWRADKAVQGFGRTHRTNEVNQPHYYLASTDIPAQKRFLSAIARRLDQLGALTKGQRDTANQGLFSEKDNLESKYATQAVRSLLDGANAGQIADLDFNELLRQMGLEDIVDPTTHQIAESKYPPTQQFLNRMLSLTLDMQGKVFDAFATLMDEKVQVAIKTGEIDAGVETIRALETKIQREELAYTDPKSGAETKYVELELTHATKIYPFQSLAERSKSYFASKRKSDYVVNVKSGRVYLRTATGMQTQHKDGRLLDRFSMEGTGGHATRTSDDFAKKENWKEVKEAEARALWEAENAKKEPTWTERAHMLVGAILPIWDRINADRTLKVVRTQTTDGRRLLGMRIYEDQLGDILKRLNVESAVAKMKPAQIMAEVLKGKVAELANGWKIERARVSNDVRVEIIARSLYGAAERELLGYGVIGERISFQQRFFIPTGADGVQVLEKILKSKPAVDLTDPRQQTAAKAADDEDAGQFRRGDATQSRGLSSAEIRTVLAQALAALKVPYALHATLEAARAATGFSDIPNGVKGAYFKGKLHLIAENIAGPLMAEEVFWHEVNHAGLDAMYGSGSKAYENALRGLALQNANIRAAAKVWMERYGKEDYEGRVAAGVNPERAMLRTKLQAVDEALAELAGRNATIKGLPRFIAQVQKFMRAIGLTRLANALEGMTDAQALSMILGARDAVTHRRQAQGAGALQPAFSAAVEGPSASDGVAQFSRGGHLGALDARQERALKAVGALKQPLTAKERFTQLRSNLGTRLAQGLFDQFAPIKDLDPKAYMMARLSKGSEGTMEAALLYGKPFLRDGVPDVDMAEGGFAKVLAALKGEHDRFLWWVAANRAERLKAEGRENLFTDQDISDLKTLADGDMADGTSRAQAFATALRGLNEYNDAVLKMAEESGLIDAEARELFKGQPYVPFYRVMEDEMTGPRFSSGLVNQSAYKKLKGGTNQLNDDLLENMLLNWAHLYTAAARNRAALATMEAADRLAIAYKINPHAGSTKKAVKVMRDGVAEHWQIEDPYLLEAVTALHYTPSPLMKPLAKMKQLMTFGVTVNPAFKVRNLLRDSIASLALADMNYNPLKNVVQGWKTSGQNAQTYASMLASGGVMKFGTQENAERMRHKIARLGGTLVSQGNWSQLSQSMIQLWEAYEELGDRSENVNRTALYEQLIAKGKTHAEASFMARDLMDFSMSGRYAVVRFLIQTVPFLNARLQGMYKLGRAAKEDPKRFATIAAAVSMASLALLAAYSDDDDWKKREDWDRDNYWWFKVGDTAYRIPRPFEIGAIGTLAERTAELMFSKEMTAQRFGDRLSFMIGQTFALNPVPQAVSPLFDVYANRDAFRRQPIESMHDKSLQPQDRHDERTSEAARFLGQLGLPEPLALAKGEYNELSPKQWDFLLRGYFSWIGASVASLTDYAIRPMMDRGARPDMKIRGGFVEPLPSGGSRYVSVFYEQARDIQEAFASYRAALKDGDTERAQQLLGQGKVQNHIQVGRIRQRLDELNALAKRIEGNRMMSGEVKRTRLDAIDAKRNEIASSYVLRKTP